MGSWSLFRILYIGLCVLPLKGFGQNDLDGEPSRRPSFRVVSKSVGRVGDYVLTSREVLANRILEREFYSDQPMTVSEDLDSPDFVMQVTAALLEKVIALEAESFSVAVVGDDELGKYLDLAKKASQSVKALQALDLTPVELQDQTLRKLRSKKFLKYKTDAANLTVTEFEIRDYYEKSRYKFGGLPLEGFRESIRQFLIQKQTEDRLREWFEVLRKKYQVRNFMSEVG